MGVIRGGLLILLVVVLFFTLLLVNTFYVMSLSLEYENVQEEISPFVYDLANGTIEESLGIVDELNLIEFGLEQKTAEAIDAMPDYCEEYDEYVFVFEDYVITLSCSSMEEGRDAVISEAVDSFVESAYYNDYDCGFWNCFRETGLPFFLISEKSKDYWQEKFYFFLIFFLVLAVLVFVLVEQKQNTPIVLGSFLVLSSLPLLRLQSFTESVTGKIFAPFIRVFFSRADVVFWTVFLVGLVVFVLGVGLRLWQSDMIKKKFSKTDVKKIVKSEIDKYRKRKEKLDSGTSSKNQGKILVKKDKKKGKKK